MDVQIATLDYHPHFHLEGATNVATSGRGIASGVSEGQPIGFLYPLKEHGNFLVKLGKGRVRKTRGSRFKDTMSFVPRNLA